jgi:transcription antitermination factor NusG
MLAIAQTMHQSTQELPGTRWYAGFSVNNSIDRALGCLRNHYGRDRVFYPMVRELRPTPKRTLSKSQRRNPIGSSMTVLRPLWPRYVLIRFSLLDGAWHDLFALAHVNGLLCDDGGGKPMPAPIDEAEIAKVQAMQIDGAIPARATVKRMSFAVGEEVRISFGAFAGHNGTVDKLPDVPIEELDETDRLRLLVSLFGCRIPVELEISDIEKL